MTIRRFEDTCVRPEYRKFKDRTNYRQWSNSTQTMVQKGQNLNMNHYQTNYNKFNQGNNRPNYRGQNNLQYRQEGNFNTNNNKYNSNNNNYNNNGNFNNSGHYEPRIIIIIFREIRFAQVGNPRPNVS